MARIRSLKPEFWDDRKLARSTSRDARMLYMGLWNQADEHGRLNGDVVWLKGRIFPYEADITTEVMFTLLEELEKANRISQYEVDGDPFIYLPKLSKHQRLEPAKVESRLPAPPSAPGAHPDRDESEPRADESAPDPDESALLYGTGSMDQGEGDAREEARADPPAEFCSKHPKGTDAPCGPCKTARLRYAAWTKTTAGRESAARAAAIKARESCSRCHGSGWLEDDAGKPTRKCDHRIAS